MTATDPHPHAGGRLAFIDWMKALGITVIVVGHVAAAPINALTPPIYPKQLGVAFFLFVMGFSLARDSRPPDKVVFGRLFAMFLFGVPIALLVTGGTFASSGRLALSNYLPFVLGANLLFNNFPANPTTWYIGTYIHVLVLWALVARHLRVRPWMLGVSIAVEIGCRTALLAGVGEYTSYMLVSNWVTVFLMGTWYGQQRDISVLRPPASWGRLGYLLLLAAWAAGWLAAVRPFVVDRSFPFMRLSSAGPWRDALVTAAAVSLVYLSYTLLVYQVVRRLSCPTFVKFVARNTLLVFIAHMPVFYALEPVLRAGGWSYTGKSVVLVVVCLPGLAALSEAIHRRLNPQSLKAWALARIWGSPLSVRD